MSILTTESNNENTRDIDTRTTLEMVQLMNAEDALVAAAVATQAQPIARAVEVIVAQLKAGGRLFYVGAGTSGRLGVLDASECPPTFHTPPDMVQAIIAGGDEAICSAVENAEDDEEAGANVITAHAIGPSDVVVGIAASGTTPFVLAALTAANQAGIPTIGICCNERSPLEAVAGVAIVPVVGPEIIQGSTRLKAGTAQKMVLNMLTTCSMIRLGKVYGNLMVDLVPTNEKLRERAKKIIQDATGVDEAAAAEFFEKSGYSSKRAIVMIRCNCPKEKAQELLDQYNGMIAAIPCDGSKTKQQPFNRLQEV